METPQNKTHHDPDKLRRMYWGAGMSQAEIASAFCVSRASIQRAMHKYDIPTRGNGGTRQSAPPFYTRTDGYESWSVYDCGTTHTIYIHQLIAIAEGEDPKKMFGNQKYDVHHENGIKWDNRPDNLEVVTSAEHYKIHYEQGDMPDQKEYTDEELVEWIDIFVDYFGIVPTSEDLIGWPGPHPLTYSNRFGSWTEAVRVAGYTPRGATDE